MIDVSKVGYEVVAITAEGRQINISEGISGLSWTEGAKELSAKITLKVTDAEYEGEALSHWLRPFTPLIVYATIDGSSEEVIRGNVTKWKLNESNREKSLTIEAADEVQALRKNQDEMFFSEGHGAREILSEILKKWGVIHEIRVADTKLTKKVYRKKYLSDMIADVLKDIKERGGGVYFVRAKCGVVEIIERGTNEVTYHFDIERNVSKVEESYDVSGLVTRVQVVGKSVAEGHQKVEATVEGRVEWGVRQVIYERGDKTTLSEAETAARKILDEQGQVKRETILEAADIPTLRKGDRIRVGSSLGISYFFVKSITHNATNQVMKLTLDEDKERNAAEGLSYDTNYSDESGSSTPP